MKTKVEIGVMLAKAEGNQKLAEARKNTFLEPFEGVWPCQLLDLEPTASRAVNQHIPVGSGNLFVVLCYGSPNKLLIHNTDCGIFYRTTSWIL